ncbi:RNA polymerase sigma factor [Blastopirellula marina]|uniref:Probable RNA polymerase ECF-type sigma factor n=1 Tax=Blastopirellula marina DSM 3645 TaxID=314230 RepID=A3ZM76_9BACT|nr:sigma-70 family RNA polymerase sigma factor [Blastopirellula marina]EAQ82114.1 probable RNA polymerase ECF-type sigma factor [Blastopirellula marina DSM 3645]
MSDNSESDFLLIERIRAGDADAWGDLIGRYEGRLLAFAESRLRRRAPSEDVVQETFIGFLNSLPNYDGKRALESYLFAICAYKLTDHLRREGRRPTLPIHTGGDGSSDNWELPGTHRAASSIARSGERRNLEEAALIEAIQGQLDHWRSRGDWAKIKSLELIMVRGVSNKEIEEMLELGRNSVASYKNDFLAKLRAAVRKQGLNEEVFPELYETS